MAPYHEPLAGNLPNGAESAVEDLRGHLYTLHFLALHDSALVPVQPVVTLVRPCVAGRGGEGAPVLPAPNTASGTPCELSRRHPACPSPSLPAVLAPPFPVALLYASCVLYAAWLTEWLLSVRACASPRVYRGGGVCLCRGDARSKSVWSLGCPPLFLHLCARMRDLSLSLLLISSSPRPAVSLLTGHATASVVFSGSQLEGLVQACRWLLFLSLLLLFLPLPLLLLLLFSLLFMCTRVA